MGNQKLRAAIIGCGNIAGGYDQRISGDQILTHAKAFASNSNTELVAVSDPDSAKLKSFAATWRVAKTYGQPERLWAEEQIDIVSICAPNEFHYDLVKQAVQHQPKAIICEKPLALSSAEGEEMIQLCQKRGILLAVNYMRRWDPTLAGLAARIRSREFGYCQSARVYYTKGVFHNASHAINLLQSWFGNTDEPIVWSSRPWQKGDVSASFCLPFAECRDVAFQGANADSFNFFEIELILEKARVLLPGGGGSLVITRTEPSAIVPGESSLRLSPEVIPGTLKYALKAVVDNVVSAVLGGQQLAMPPEDALETLRICERIVKLGEKYV